MTYARLLRVVYPRRAINAFAGKLFQPGSMVDEAELWPAPDYPKIPILLEYAGSDYTGRGHNRSNDIYILWRYDAAAGTWLELVRCLSQCAEWVENLKPIALRELGREGAPADAWHAATVSGRILGFADQQFDELAGDELRLAMTLLYQEFTARVVAY